MFKHDKALLKEVRVEKPNPQYAVLMQEQLGGGNGELKAAMQYLSQSFRIKDPEIKDLFLDIAAEIQTHVQCGLAPVLINSSGAPWTADYVTVTGDLVADLLSNIASEQRAKVVYEYLYRQIDDKYVRETIDFLLNREEAHNALFREALNKVKDTGSNKSFGVTEDSKLYFDLSSPGPHDHNTKIDINPPSFETPIKK